MLTQSWKFQRSSWSRSKAWQRMVKTWPWHCSKKLTLHRNVPWTMVIQSLKLQISSLSGSNAWQDMVQNGPNMALTLSKRGGTQLTCALDPAEFWSSSWFGCDAMQDMVQTLTWHCLKKWILSTHVPQTIMTQYWKCQSSGCSVSKARPSMVQKLLKTVPTWPRHGPNKYTL